MPNMQNKLQKYAKYMQNIYKNNAKNMPKIIQNMQK